MQPGKPLPDIRSLMAVINSVGVGRGSKSVGEFTYRYTRGRTIASRRITKNTSKTPAQVGRRGAFGSFVWMFSPYKWFFSDGYEKTKHGSSFNQFVHVNRELLGKSPSSESISVSQPLDLQFVAQPDGTYKADNVSGVVVSYNPSTGEASYVIQLNTYVKGVLSTTVADNECAVFPCFKVNYRLVNRFQTPSFEYKTA